MGSTAAPLSLRLAAGTKVLIAGQNGSGKSVLATSIARGFDRVLVYDPKEDPNAELPGAAIVTSARDAVRALPGRVIYRPTAAELERIEAKWEEVVRKIADDARAGRGSTAVVVHELADLCTAYAIGPAWRWVIAAGRRYGVTVVMVTQRPQGIPVLCRSEAQHVACFTLLAGADRALMEELMSGAGQGGPIARAPLPLDFTWWYRGPDLRLRLCQPVPVGRSESIVAPPAARPSHPPARR